MEIEYKVIGNGSTVLVLENGIGGSFYDWYPILKEIINDFTVVLYHRHGYGKSSIPIKPRTTRNIADELNILLETIGIKDKFILLGHSFGGLCVQHYAKIFGHKLSGVMLIDSTSYNYRKLYKLDIPVMNSLISIDKLVESNILASRKTKDELKNQNINLISTYKKSISDSEMHDVEEFFSSPVLYKTIAGEFENWDLDSKEIKVLESFPNIPLIVIARDNVVAEKFWVKNGIPEKEAILYEDQWRKLQIELSLLSQKGKLIIAENSDHEVYLDRPDIIIHNLKMLL
jgi:pimeloyl-ACP methyl ester carboxylesterase